MGDRLPALLEGAGLRGVASHADDEVTQRGGPDFAAASAIWLQVIESLGPRILPDEAGRRRAEEAYREFVEGGIETQRLSLRTVIGAAVS